MRIKTIIERGDRGEILVMDHTGLIQTAKTVKAAKKIIKHNDSEIAKTHGSVINTLEWRGFSLSEIE